MSFAINVVKQNLKLIKKKIKCNVSIIVTNIWGKIFILRINKNSRLLKYKLDWLKYKSFRIIY